MPSGLKLPTAIAIGPPRTATTWMYRLMAANPGAGVPRIKEIDFFNTHYERGLDWYAEFFVACPPELPRVEFCPNYFADLKALERIARELPDCAIAATLRDPVARAWSHYRLLHSRGLSRAGFEEMVRTPGSPLHESGRYAFYLGRWRARFGRVTAMMYEDFAAEPRRFVADFYSFIGAAPVPAAEAIMSARRRINTAERDARHPRLARAATLATRWLDAHRCVKLKKLAARMKLWRLCFAPGREFPLLDPRTEASLRAFYAPEIARLEDLLDRSLDCWRHTAPQGSDRPRESSYA